MELNEMKVLWDQMSKQMEQKELLNETMIHEITQQRYNKKFSHIFKWEGMGALVCFAMTLYILFRFGQLDTWYLSLFGVLSLIILVSLPSYTLFTLTKLRNLDVGKRSYKDTLLTFRKRKNQFLQAQRLGIYLSFGLVLVILPVFAKILNGKDILLNPKIWYGFMFWGTIFISIIGRWGYTCYQHISQSAERLIEELEE